VGKVRFYTDEHVSKAIVRGLRERGVEVLTVVEAGKRGASDQEHLAFARLEGYVIVTQDDDFLRLHATGAEHAGIVFAKRSNTTGEMIRELLLIAEVLTAEEMSGQVEFL